MAFCVVQQTDDPKTQAAIRCWCRHLWIKPTATCWYVMKTSSIQQNILSSHLRNVPFMTNIVPFLSTPTHAFACRPSRRRAAWLRAGTRRPLCNGGPCRTMWVEEQQARSETTTWVVIVSVVKVLVGWSFLSDQRSQKVEVQVKMCQVKIATLTVSLGPRKLEMLIDNHGYLQKMLHTTLLCCWCCKKSQEPIDSKTALQELWCSTLAVRITPPPFNLEETSKGAGWRAAWQTLAGFNVPRLPKSPTKTAIAQGTRQVNWWWIFQIQVNYGGLWWIHLYSWRHAS